MTIPLHTPALVVTGTGRSGTTLAARLLGELPQVRELGGELNFFRRCATRLVLRHGPAVSRLRAGEALGRYAAQPDLAHLRLVPADVLARLDADPDADDAVGVLDLYAAVVASLLPDAEVTLEKSTLGSLPWLDLLVAHDPQRTAVVVVRDPRAVAASVAGLGWVDDTATVARRWQRDQRLVLAHREVVDPGRLLVVRYEDLVADPGAFQHRVASAAGLGSPAAPPTPDPARARRRAAYHPHVDGPVRPELAHRWTELLTPAEEARILRTCGPTMAALGYDLEPRACATRSLLTPQNRRVRQSEVAIDDLDARRDALAAAVTRDGPHRLARATLAPVGLALTHLRHRVERQRRPRLAATSGRPEQP